MLFSVLAMVFYLACLICAWGFISLLSETDVIAESVGPLVGPIMAGLASVLTFFCTLFSLRNARTALSWPEAVIAAASTYLVPSLIGGAIVAFDRADLTAGLLFFAERATGPYIPAAAILAAAVVLVAPTVGGARRR